MTLLQIEPPRFFPLLSGIRSLVSPALTGSVVYNEGACVGEH